MGIDQARSQLTAFGQRMEQAFPAENRGMKDVASVFPSTEIRQRGAPGDTPTLVALLMGLFGLVLLVACGNVAGLLMVRGAGRRQEIAVRFALGASRRRVVQSLLTEGLLLASIGTAAALLLVVWLAPVMSAYGLPGLGGAHVDLQPDLTLVAYAAADNAVHGLRLRHHACAAFDEGSASLPIYRKAAHERPPVICGCGTPSSSLRSPFPSSCSSSHRSFCAACFASRRPIRDSTWRTASSYVFRRRQCARAAGCGKRADRRPLAKCRRRAIGELGDAHSARQRFARRAIRHRGAFGSRRTDATSTALRRDISRRCVFRCCAGAISTSNDRAGAQQVAIVSESFARAYFPGEESLGKLVDHRTRRNGARLSGS